MKLIKKVAFNIYRSLKWFFLNKKDRFTQKVEVNKKKNIQK